MTKETPKTIELVVWVKDGEMLVNSSALHHSHPMHPYNQIVAMGLSPEDYGIDHPLEMEYGHLSRGELISKIDELSREIEAMHRAGF